MTASARIEWLVVLAVVLAGGCKDPRKDMAAQPKYRPYEPAAMFADGASARPLVAGTIARDPGAPGSRAWGANRNTTPAMSIDLAASQSIPFAIDADAIARGQQGFDVYCALCHGRLANGNGMIVQRGFPRPPSFHVDRLLQAPDAHFYDVITNGFGAMYGYAERVPPRLRWEIVAYVRALQAAGKGVAAAADRAELIAAGDRPASIPMTAATTTQPAKGRP